MVVIRYNGGVTSDYSHWRGFIQVFAISEVVLCELLEVRLFVKENSNLSIPLHFMAARQLMCREKPEQQV